MTPAGRLSASIEILEQFDGGDSPLDRICDSYFKSRRYIGSGDRRFISHLVFATMRNARKLDWWAGYNSAHAVTPSPRLRVLAAAIFILQWEFDAIIDAAADERGCGTLSDTEASWLAALTNQKSGLISDAMSDGVKYECPDWLLPKIQAAYPESWAKELELMQAEAPVDFRVNTLKADREKIFAEISRAVEGAEKTPYSPCGIRLKTRQAFGSLPQIKDGTIEVQDEGSQIITILCDARPGHQVMDYCAGAGGKSLALAAMMQNKGRIVACDNHSRRLKNATERFRRAGVHNYELKLLDAESKKWLSRQAKRFDRVLCDVPCSGTGTWRRNPDLRYRFDETDLAELITLQQDILRQASKLVTPGGKLIYSTCSMLPEENEAQIEEFLKSNPDFVIPAKAGVQEQQLNLPDNLFAHYRAKLDPRLHWDDKEAMSDEWRFLRLSPASHVTDGFFCAVMMRKMTA